MPGKSHFCLAHFLFTLVFQIQLPGSYRLTFARVCSPGRWMASALMKLAFAHILNQYEILLPSSASAPLTGSLSFEEFYVPNFRLKIAMRQR